MNFKGIYYSLTFRLALAIGLTAALTYQALEKEWGWFLFLGIGWLAALRGISLLFKRNAQKVAFMFDAIDNSDYAFKYATRGRSSNDKLVSESLNRITQILFQAKAEAIQKEKYYELIMNQVNTGIIVEDDKGNIFQTNNEALRLLGLTVFTHARQLGRIDENLERLISDVRPGEKHQISFINERGTVHLSVRVSEMTLQEKHVRIIAINDINSELDDKEIESWIRLTRVLTHEIMNSVTPITSLSDTLLSLHQNVDEEIRGGLEVISSTGKSLIAFVESYRKFTHIPTPQPSLFYVNKFAERLTRLGYTGATVRVRPHIRTAAHPYPSSYIFVSGQLHLCIRVATSLQPYGYGRTAGQLQEDSRTDTRHRPYERISGHRWVTTKLFVSLRCFFNLKVSIQT